MKKGTKKQEKISGGTITPHIINNPTHINIDGSIAGNPLSVNPDYSGLNLTGRASTVDIGATVLKNDYIGGGIFAADISTHGAIYEGTQSLKLSTQSGVLGATTLGENLLKMKINTIGDEMNFLVGVNNFASVFSENSGLLNAIESASAVVSTHSRLMTEATDRMNSPSMIRGIELATDYHLKANEVIKLSESVTTVLAYGQAVQNQFSVLGGTEIFRDGATVFRDSTIALGKISDHIPVYAGSEAITSPFVFEPRTVKTKEVEKALPEVKKELPVKTTEAIEMLEYFQKPDAKKGDKQIITTLNEVKRAMETVLGFTSILTQQTTRQITVTSIVEDLTVGHLKYHNDGALTFKNKPIEMRSQMKTLCIFFMQRHKNFIDYSTIKNEIISDTKSQTKGFKNTTKYVNELQVLLKKLFGKKVIFNYKKEGYIFDVERNSEN